MILDSIKVIGSVEITHYDENMVIKDLIHINNLVVQTGKNLIASRLSGNLAQPISHMAVGSSAAITTIDTLSLGQQVGIKVVMDTLGGTVIDNEITFATTFVAGVCTGDLREIGLFNSAEGTGTMLSRTTFPKVSKQSADTLIVSWKITIL